MIEIPEKLVIIDILSNSDALGDGKQGKFMYGFAAYNYVVETRLKTTPASLFYLKIMFFTIWVGDVE